MHHPIMGFENIHKHSDFSILDGFGRVKEYAERMPEIDQKFLCITDHGVMGAVPQQISQSERNNLSPIFACELYVNNLQPETEDRYQSAVLRKSLGDGTKVPTPEQKKFDKSCHILAIAYSEVGYSNLVRISSWAWLHGFYRKPRVNHEVLQQYKEGIIFSTACANSEIANVLFNEGEEAALQILEKYIEMFSPHLYLELMMIDYDKQKPYNTFLLKAHEKYGTPIVMSTDCHYCDREQSHNQRLMLMQQNRRTIQEINAMIESGDADDLFELQDANLWMKSEAEMDAKWESDYQDNIDYELYKQAKANTVKICEMAKGVELNREIKLPRVPDDDAVLWEETKRGFLDRRCPKSQKYVDRIREEYDLICEKGFSSYFLIQKMMTDEARRVGPEILGFGDGSEAVGPGRGSVCGSLVAYCLRLHDVEPIIHDLRFSRFLSPARGGKQLRIYHSIPPVPRRVA